LKDAGVTPLIFKSLDDFEVIKEAAGDADSMLLNLALSLLMAGEI
jgi:hypothetical protein